MWSVLHSSDIFVYISTDELVVFGARLKAHIFLTQNVCFEQGNISMETYYTFGNTLNEHYAALVKGTPCTWNCWEKVTKEGKL